MLMLPSTHNKVLVKLRSLINLRKRKVLTLCSYISKFLFPLVGCPWGIRYLRYKGITRSITNDFAVILKQFDFKLKYINLWLLKMIALDIWTFLKNRRS